MMDDATKAQNAAADPDFSTWLSANAGSGKTRVLTDRVARMLLREVEPQNILCLTYTKAAAGEMQNRLFKRLGSWAMLDDARLRSELESLGECAFGDLDHARTLFARAIETPGGLKIQTIHSFCSGLLRQFPLEAGVSPQFKELDDQGTKELIAEVLDGLASQVDPSLSAIAKMYSGDSLTDLAKIVASKAQAFAPPKSRDEVFRHFGVAPDLTLDRTVADALTTDDLLFLRSLAPAISTSDLSSDQTLSAELASLPTEATLAALEALEGLLLLKSGANAYQPRSTPPTKKLRDGILLSDLPRYETIQANIASARALRISLRAAEKTAALHAFASAFLPLYRAAKDARAVLDFDDLIERARILLTDLSLAWVLYRLDGNIDHILVDEAQDTSPAQWQVIAALAEEIASGQGSRASIPRSLFVVGDKKQSIYSFQGADARAFDTMANHFSRQLSHQTGLKTRNLAHSFRSSAAILNTVDSVFVEDAARGLGIDFRHIAFHETRAGRVDLWPQEQQPPKLDEPAWYDPVDREVANAPAVLLAERIAKRIREMIETETIPGENGESRRINAGDFLILVQGRSSLFDHIIRACKTSQLPIAGADRLKISAELAVRDLLALLSFLALPEDDLSLAAALRSPLFGWSEADLYQLAQGRKSRYLWAELRNRQAEFPETFSRLIALRDRSDFLRPFELLELILTRHGGRRALLSRLGPEAEDGIDELLNQALSFEQSDVPSLTAFLVRAKAEDIDIKRQTDSSGGLIRVMTVHGAKGLEAPIVILPDTTRVENARSGEIIVSEDGVPLWPLSGTECPDLVSVAKGVKADAEREERQRLLYVAMTRAEHWLIVCGLERGDKRKDVTWHDLVRAGLERADAIPVDTPTGIGLRLQHGDWPTPSSITNRETVSKKENSPDFYKTDARPAPLKSEFVTPSDLGGAKIVFGATDGLEEAAAMRRGRQIHLLLEHLPALSPGERQNTALRLLSQGPDLANSTDANSIAKVALRIIDAFPEIFAAETLAEVDITAHLPSLSSDMRGTIDRLNVTPDRILAVDFKTNATPPDCPEKTPEGVLRQMGAYLEALEQIWPDRTIDLAILWTSTATLMPIDHGIVRRALTSSTTS